MIPYGFLPKIPRKLAAGLLLGIALVASAHAEGENLPDIQRLVKQGQYPQALERVEAYIAAKPKDAQGRFLKGIILTEMNRPNDAIAVFSRLTEDYPELPEPYNNLAVLYAQQKQYEKARTALEMAIRTHPSYAIAHENLGDVYAKLASQAYDKALQLDSGNAGAQSKLSLIRDLITTSGRPTGKPVPSASVAAAAPRIPEPARASAVEPIRPAPAPTPTPAPEPVKAAVPPPPPAPSATASLPPPPPPRPPAEPRLSDARPDTKAEAKADTRVETAAPEARNGESEQITRVVQGWALAWSGKDVKSYLAYYAPAFQTPGGQNRRAWETERTNRIDKPGRIEVDLENIRVSLDGPERAVVQFRQHYKSANLKSSTAKTLVLMKNGSRWQIVQEKVAG